MIESLDPGLERTLQSALRENGIPPCPAVLQKIAEEMRQEEPDLRRVAQTICTDVGLAAGVIKTANSPYFGVRRRVPSVMDALLILGLDIASRAVACIVLEKLFPNPRGIERFWDASARIARLSGWLARDKRWPEIRSEDAYTFGLFRDAGIAVLIQRFPDYVKVLHRANDCTDRSFTAVENEVLPTDHSTVGAMLTQSWWLPELISTAIHNHHDLLSPAEDISAESNRAALSLAAISQLAEHLLQSTTGMSRTREWEKMGPACLAHLDMDPGEVESLALAAKEIVSEDL